MTEKASAKPGRNQPCHCGSGRKYKHCCLDKDEAAASAARAKAAEESADVSEDAASDAGKSAPKRPSKPKTDQPWKKSTSKGFAQKTRMPRKIGGG